MRFVVFVCLISGLLRSCELLLFNKLESETLSNCYKVYNLSVPASVQSKMELDSIRVANLHECKLLAYLDESGIADHDWQTKFTA
jgi:hypothetical protein